MKYVYPIDINAFWPNEFHSQFAADPETGLESAHCILTRVPPGMGTTSGPGGNINWPHIHPSDQIYYVLKGEMTPHLGDKQYKAHPGEEEAPFGTNCIKGQIDACV